MNRRILTGLLLGLLFVLAWNVQPVTAAGMEIMPIEDRVVVSDTGDAVFTISLKFNASQYQGWQQRYGTNPSLLKREMSKTLSPYDITQFKVDKNDMDRAVTVTIGARGVVTYLGDGLYQMQMPKEWRLNHKDQHELKLSFAEPMDQGLMGMHNITVTLPDRAYDVTDPMNPERGQMHVQYKMPTGGRVPWLIIAGIVVVLLGLGMMLVGAASFAIGGRKPADTASSAKKK